MSRPSWRVTALLVLGLPACCLFTTISLADSGWARVKRPSLTRPQSRAIELLSEARQKAARELKELLARHEQGTRINPNGLNAEFLAADAQRQALFLKALDGRIKQLSKAP